MIEIVLAVLSSLACIAGFLLEWRRLGTQAEVAALEARVVQLEARPHLDGERLVAVEAALERLRRNL